ncbi:alanyl-tRNA synthetase [Methylobacter tundripaludum]|uniref:Alanine--tRNA ligase n=2 Tax=Methylobacter tundripaludum TaxID=173365 RepID=A0A2S6HF29_9GAMM|nr:alanine--tRNA ligase [Methylobacter tundripaludum]PPK76099.1 alanyl-tRNA synthetase [Methylobacter tundripaludum]
MKKMTSAQLRTAFLEFFRERGHSVQPSSSLIPGNDPTLLFTNAGMVQFKDVFLGRDHRDYNKAATSQRCVRAGGKHNDLENVGYTARHHTFFEMLGNFSFGDYFKKEAIHFAWDFLTKELEIPAEKLWITVFDEDSEAEKIWLDDVGVSPVRFSRIGAKDNFWSMGDVGPCGPCTEIFYDHGADIAGGPPGSPDEDGDRYIEIWNLVFMQYDRSADGSLTPLPKPSVDTGMGLERIAAVLQGVHSNYEIDLFQKLLKAAAELAGTSDLTQSSLRVIADHIRSCAFLIADGVMPSNEGRGYVVRRIIRRAIRHGYRLGIRDVFFYKLVAPLAEEMGEAFPELKAAQEQVERVLKKEEERFAETLEQGMKILEACVAKMEGSVIPGDTVFQLYDTYGFPVDLTADFARENNLTVDHAGFETAMSAQRERARSASSFGADYDQDIKLDAQTEFTGYDHLDDQVHIIGLYKKGQPVDSLEDGEEGVVILDKTPFYAESGGQIGDCGKIEADGAVFEVTDTQKQGGNLFLHKGKLLAGTLTNGQLCDARVSAADRTATELNHSATHLLHAALRQVLGDHVAQKGSLVNPERLRFDFSHFEPVTASEISTVERIVNEQIRANNPVSAKVMAKDDAVKAGAMALFGEKYGDEVRVLKIGEFSTELCGGTHVERAGDIGCFKIINETGVAAGVRRIEAVTGGGCIEWIAGRDHALASIAGLVKSAPEKTPEKVEQLIEKNRLLEKQLERLNAKLASSAGNELGAQAVDVGGIKVLAVKLDGVDPKSLKDMVDQLKNKLGSAAIVLAVVDGDKVSLIAGVTKDRMGRIKAGDLVNFVATKVGGKGGGRPDMAQAGGNDPSGLADALAQVPAWIQTQLGA